MLKYTSSPLNKLLSTLSSGATHPCSPLTCRSIVITEASLLVNRTAGKLRLQVPSRLTLWWPGVSSVMWLGGINGD